MTGRRVDATRDGAAERSRPLSARPGPRRGFTRRGPHTAGMIGPRGQAGWVGLVCDARGVGACAARRADSGPTLVSHTYVELNLEESERRGRLRELERFVAENGLTGWPACVAFAGPGTIVQKLTMPPLRRADRDRAVRTRLASYADDRELVVDTVLDAPTPGRRSGAGRREAVRLLAAGVDCRLTRAIYQACRRARLHVRAMTAVASVYGPPDGNADAVQLILGERTTTIQVFADRRLVGCRDVLIGRQDFVAACQRPLLTDQGPVTLGATQADELVRSVGVPFGREDEVCPGVMAAQLWPTLNPVLQKLLHEIEQSLATSGLEEPQNAGLAVLGLPVIPGLDAFLAAELRLPPPLMDSRQAEARFLDGLAPTARGPTVVDLRPPEERFGSRWTRPALAAGLCALLVILANSAPPRRAHARLAELPALLARLEAQSARVEQIRKTLARECGDLVAIVRRDQALLAVLPPEVPAVAVLKAALSTLPECMELQDIRLSMEEKELAGGARGDDSPGGPADFSARCELRVAYRGVAPAGIVASSWARDLAEIPFLSDVRVKGITGDGRSEPALIELTAELALRSPKLVCGAPPGSRVSPAPAEQAGG